MKYASVVNSISACRYWLLARLRGIHHKSIRLVRSSPGLDGNCFVNFLDTVEGVTDSLSMKSISSRARKCADTMSRVISAIGAFGGVRNGMETVPSESYTISANMKQG